MKLIAFLLIIFFCFSCDQTEIIVKVTQFSEDDLEYLYFYDDSLMFTGESILYTDSLTFLLNNSEIKKVAFITIIDTLSTPLWIFKVETGIQGETVIRFDNCEDFKYAEVGVYRNDENSVSTKYFSVKANGSNPFVYEIPYNVTLLLDTVEVQGKTYYDVYKFEPPIEYHSNIKVILFSKKDGYIKIETYDGKTIELMN